MPEPVTPGGPGRLEAALLRLGTVGELLAMLGRGGRWWLLPLVLVLLVVSVALVLLQAAQYVAPFIYVAI